MHARLYAGVHIRESAGKRPEKNFRCLSVGRQLTFSGQMLVSSKDLLISDPRCWSYRCGEPFLALHMGPRAITASILTSESSPYPQVSDYENIY